jgi:probable rRNA maturation factor
MAAPAHEILITIDERFVSDVAEEWLVAIARHVLEVERVGDCELGIVITDDDTVRRLNREYAGEDHATDVLSFSLREGEEFASPDAVDRLGEVIISYLTATRQAKEAGRSVDDETAHLLVHGILHLLGYDHAEPEEEREMRARESGLIGGCSGHPAL